MLIEDTEKIEIKIRRKIYEISGFIISSEGY